MKKLLSAFVGILVLCLLLAIGDYTMNRQTSGGGSHTLTVYNWGDYIDPALIKNLNTKAATMLTMKLSIVMNQC